MSGVFISYRREDSSGYAGRLFDILSVHFGEENTYMDLDTIKGGDNFVMVIDEKVSQCDALLAVIGERWLTITGENGSRRLDMAGDFVRLEIAKALERGVRVIPVLVGGAKLPQQQDLPDDLRALSLHQAMDLRDAHFHTDANQLMDVLKKTVPNLTSPLRKVRSNRFAWAVSSILAVAVVAGGILVFRQIKPAAHPNPDSVVQQPSAPASVPVPSAQAVKPIEADKSRSPNQGPADISGKWKATVKYDWPGAIYEETFNFEVDGTEVSGTASFLQVGHGILEGKIEGDRVRFTTKSLTTLDDKTSQDTHNYRGTVAGDTIQFSMMTDSSVESHVPVHFTAKR
jgi:TIR domain-containing protein